MRKSVQDPVTAAQVNLAMRANEKFNLSGSAPIDFYATGAGVFTLPHDLQVIPDGMLHDRVDNIDVYATQNQRLNNWKSDVCEVTATGAGNARVWFFTRIV